jgi:hypothetical protein
MAKAKSKTAERAVVICTAKRAVVFGYTSEGADEIMARGTVSLVRARLCTYWSKETHGVFGLSNPGPQNGSRIGPRGPKATLGEITAVLDCSDEATKAWESEMWT